MSAYPSSGTTSGYDGVQLLRWSPFSGERERDRANCCGLVAGEGNRGDPLLLAVLGGVSGAAAEYRAKAGFDSSGGGVMGRSGSGACVLKMVEGEVSFLRRLSILFGPSESSCLPNNDFSLPDFGES